MTLVGNLTSEPFGRETGRAISDQDGTAWTLSLCPCRWSPCFVRPPFAVHSLRGSRAPLGSKKASQGGGICCYPHTCTGLRCNALVQLLRVTQRSLSVTLTGVFPPPAINAAGALSLRTVRLLKPLRTISTNKAMRTLVTALVNCIPMLFNVLALWMLVFVLFGIVGMQLWMGQVSVLL